RVGSERRVVGSGFVGPLLELRMIPVAELERRTNTSGSEWTLHMRMVIPVGDSKGQRATKDMGKMLGGEGEEKDPDAAKKEEERQEALRQQEDERKGKYAKMEAERENIRQGIRDKYGIKKKEEKEAEAAAAMEQASEGSLTRPKKAVPTGCGDEEEEESIVDTVMKFIPTPLMDMFNKK
ncbi:Complexin-1, partial [Dissostichus eleginoides]